MNNINKKIKAGTLIPSLYIIILITITASIFILFYHYQRQLVDFKTQNQILNDQILSIFNINLNNDVNDYCEEKIKFENNSFNIKINKKLWGFFEIHHISGQFKHQVQEKIALVGHTYTPKIDYALFLENNIYSLTLSGYANISGRCAIPGGYFNKGTVKGKRLVTDKPINGIIEKSDKLPSIKNSIINFCKEIITRNYYADSVFNIDKPLQGTYFNSFSSPTITLYSDNSININALNLDGNFIIKSDTLVVISSNTKLENTIITAPVIIVEENVSGTMQLIARDSVIVKRNSHLQFPSMVSLFNDSFRKSFIIVEDNVKIEGGIALFAKNKSSIIVYENAVTEGLIFSKNYLELYGNTKGYVYASQLLLKTKMSEYENYLYNATIDPYAINKYYVGPVLFVNKSNKELITWLY